MLVIFEAEKKAILNTGIYYLIQMHVALFFVLAAFTLIFIQNENALAVEKVHPLESLSPLLLIGVVLVFGVVSPDFLIQLIQQAIQVLPGGHVLTINN